VLNKIVDLRRANSMPIVENIMHQEDLFEKYTSEFARKEWIDSIVKKKKERS
jgi:hypothetical protein